MRSPPRPSRRAIALGALLAPLALGACRGTSPKPVDFSETPRSFLSKDYATVYDNWTRHVQVVYGEGTLIEVWATLKSWEFREAYIEHYAEVYGLGAAEKAKLREAQLEASRRGYEVHLAAQMTDYRWNDLERRSSPWRITLVDGSGDHLEARSVTAPRLPALYGNEFFPNPGSFTRTYVVDFDASGDGDFGGPATGSLTLRIAGPSGHADLVWHAR